MRRETAFGVTKERHDPPALLTELYAALALLSVFIVYLKVLFSLYLPGSCGGVMSSLRWQGHVVFNLAFMGLTAIGIRRGFKG